MASSARTESAIGTYQYRAAAVLNGTTYYSNAFLVTVTFTTLVLELTGPSDVYAGEPFQLTARVTSDGANAAGVHVNFTDWSGNVAGTAVTDELGVASVSVTLDAANSAVNYIARATASGATYQSNVLAVQAHDRSSTFTLTGPDAATVGTPFSMTATVIGADGAPLTNAFVDFVAMNGASAGTSVGHAYTDGSGVATVTHTENAQGTVAFRATVLE